MAALLFYLITSPAMAHPGRGASFGPNAISVTAGLAVPNYFTLLANLVGLDIGGSSGPYQLGAQYQVSDLINLGLQYSHTGARSLTMSNMNYATNTSYTYYYSLALNSVLVNCDFYYLNKKRIALYSGVGLGYAVLSARPHYSDGVARPDDIDVSFSRVGFQLRAFGMKADIAKGFGVYTDVGFGYNGLLALGLHYTFGSRG